MNIKIELDLPDEFKNYFEYFENYFNINKKQYLEFVIEKEIFSRNEDLNII